MAKRTIGARIDSKDLNAVIGKLTELGSAMVEQVKNEVELTAYDIETDAKKNCPVDTGRLRASIIAMVDRDKIAALVGTNVEYAAHVELGTHKQTPQPYLYPAFFLNTKKMFDRLSRLLDNAKKP